MATHSSILAWRIPWTEEPGRPQSIVRLLIDRASLVAQLVENPPAMWETWVHSLSQEATLEEGMATHSSILAWRIPWTEDVGELQSIWLHRVGHN